MLSPVNDAILREHYWILDTNNVVLKLVKTRILLTIAICFRHDVGTPCTFYVIPNIKSFSTPQVSTTETHYASLNSKIKGGN